MGEYKINYKVLSSSDFGVPQSRSRLIVIGVRPDIAKACGIKNYEDVLELFPQGSIDKPTLRDALQDVVVDRRERSLLMSTMRKGFSLEIVRAISKNTARTIKIKHVHPEWKSDFSIVRSPRKLSC